MKTVLIVDDENERHIEFKAWYSGLEGEVTADHVVSAQQAITKLDTTKYDLVMLDYNLGSLEYSGEDVSNYILTMPKDKAPSRVIVHSLCRDKAVQMVHDILNVGIWSNWYKFGTAKLRNMFKAILTSW